MGHGVRSTYDGECLAASWQQVFIATNAWSHCLPAYNSITVPTVVWSTIIPTYTLISFFRYPSIPPPQVYTAHHTLIFTHTDSTTHRSTEFNIPWRHQPLKVPELYAIIVSISLASSPYPFSLSPHFTHSSPRFCFFRSADSMAHHRKLRSSGSSGATEHHRSQRQPFHSSSCISTN